MSSNYYTLYTHAIPHNSFWLFKKNHQHNFRCIFSAQKVRNKVFMRKRLHITRWRNDPCITHSTQINFKLTRFAKNLALEDKFDGKHYFSATFFKDRFSFFLIKYDWNNSALPKVPMSEKKGDFHLWWFDPTSL